MRKTIGDQSWLGATDIPAILIGLQAVWADEDALAKLFRLLDEHILPDRRRDTGRPGMNRWQFLVMGIMKQDMGHLA